LRISFEDSFKDSFEDSFKDSFEDSFWRAKVRVDFLLPPSSSAFGVLIDPV